MREKDKGIHFFLSLGPKPLGVIEEFHCVNLCVITESQRKQWHFLCLFASQKALGQLVSVSDSVFVHVHLRLCLNTEIQSAFSDLNEEPEVRCFCLNPDSCF